MAVDIYKYLREDKLPHIWCPGCGHGTILNSLVRAIDQTDMDPDKTVVVSGIGCSGRAPGYLKFDTLHTTHGRAIPFATGVKLANPELNVIVLTGDGDGSAIGGNHLIHGCRRNIDLTVILFNNQIYGMTGGQYSPMTPSGAVATTSPYGNIDQNFVLVDLTRSAGATFVARGATYNPRQMTKLYKEGLEHKGFSFIETLDQCPVNYGRKNKIGGPAEMLDWQKENTVSAAKWEKMSEEEKEGMFQLGVIHRRDNPESEYTALYQQIIDSLAKEDE